MKTKLLNILNAHNSLMELSGIAYKGSLSFKIAILLEAFERHAVKFHETRQAMFEQHGFKESDKNELSKDRKEKLDIEFSELLNTEIEVNIPLLSMDDLEYIQLSPARINQMKWLIEIPQTNQTE